MTNALVSFSKSDNDMMFLSEITVRFYGMAIAWPINRSSSRESQYSLQDVSKIKIEIRDSILQFIVKVKYLYGTCRGKACQENLRQLHIQYLNLHPHITYVLENPWISFL